MAIEMLSRLGMQNVLKQLPIVRIDGKTAEITETCLLSFFSRKLYGAFERMAVFVFLKLAI